MEYPGAGGKQIHEKNQKQKISWHCPFNLFLFCPPWSTYQKQCGSATLKNTSRKNLTKIEHQAKQSTQAIETKKPENHKTKWNDLYQAIEITTKPEKNLNKNHDRMDVGNRTASRRQTGNQEWSPWEPEIIIRYELYGWEEAINPNQC